MSQPGSLLAYRVELIAATDAEEPVVLEVEVHDTADKAQEALGRMEAHAQRFVAKAEQEAEDTESETQS